MTKPHIIFLGPSGSGKSTACEYLAKFHGYYDFHPYRFVKRQYETLYKLPAGYLDTVEGKADKATGMICTFQEMMVREYHFRKKTDPYYVTRNIAVELETPIKRNQPIVFQAIRNMAEAQELQKLGIKAFVVELQGRGDLASSDEQYDMIRSFITKELSEEYFLYDNSSDDLDKLYSFLFSLVVPVESVSKYRITSSHL